MTAPTPEFQPEAGKSILVQPEGQEQRFKTWFIGMDPGRYVITSLAPLTREIETLARVFTRNRRTRIFTMQEGVVYGYVVQVLGFTTTPFRHLFLSYPQRSEAYNLRTDDRVDCHIPVQLRLDGGGATGMADNVSPGGCHLCLETTDALGTDPTGERGEVRLRPNLYDAPLHSDCQVMQAQRGPTGGWLLGLRFLTPAPDVVERLRAFIRFVTEHRI